MTLELASRWALIVLATIAGFAALQFADEVFAPIALGLVIGVVLSPISQTLERHGAPGWVSALVVMLVSLVVLTGILLFLGPVFSRLFSQAPQIWLELRESIRSLQDMLRGLNDASEEVVRAISPDGSSGGAEESPRVPSLTNALFAAPAVAAQLLVFIGTLFFFVMSHNEIYDWIAHQLVAKGSRRAVAARLKDADHMVARYFLAITVINTVFGGCVAAALALIGMPQPLLWGVIAGLLNFILYLGPACVAVMLLVAGVVVYDGVAQVLPMVLFVGLNLTEGQFVTPALIGRRLSVNPLLVFLSLVFWLWLWGPLGGFIAIPLLLWGLAFTGKLPEPSGKGYWIADTSDGGKAAGSGSDAASNSATRNTTRNQ